MAFLSHGEAMWIGITAVVLSWDISAGLHPQGQTGSTWLRQHFDKRPLLVGGLILSLVLHLIGRPKWLRRYDPLHNAGRALRGLGSAWRSWRAAGRVRASSPHAA